jgi:hypothetical protein
MTIFSKKPLLISLTLFILQVGTGVWVPLLWPSKTHVTKKDDFLFTEARKPRQYSSFFVFLEGTSGYEVKWGGVTLKVEGGQNSTGEPLLYPELGSLWNGAPWWSFFLPVEEAL